MNGPVYRYDEDAEDDSVRWPEYWDGRWFLHNHGGASIKHGLLLDPATDEDGGQPVYADSLRETLSWDGNYMDSKFGPDGALYVQVYDGFFRAEPDVGLYRYDYVGGPDTPGADPRDTPLGDLRVAFLGRRVGRRLVSLGLRRRDQLAAGERDAPVRGAGHVPGDADGHLRRRRRVVEDDRGGSRVGHG